MSNPIPQLKAAAQTALLPREDAFTSQIEQYGNKGEHMRREQSIVGVNPVIHGWDREPLGSSHGSSSGG